MALNYLKDTTLPQALSEVVGDLADLFQKELRLARAEISAKISAKLEAGVWMAAAGVLGLITILLVIQAAVFSYCKLRHRIALVMLDRGQHPYRAWGVSIFQRTRKSRRRPYTKAHSQQHQTRHNDRQGATNMTEHSNKSGIGRSDWLLGSLKANPEGLLLLAAGCALLMRSGTSRADTSSIGAHDTRGTQALGQRGWEVPEGVKQTAESARNYASDLSRSVSEKASDYASSVGEYADKARRTVTEESGKLIENTQSSVSKAVDRILRDQPLAVALVGLAAGVAVAAAFPATGIEQQTLGPAGEKLTDVAAKTGEHIQEAAAAAGERLKSTAEERGLTAAGLKEMASEAAGAFGSALTGEQKDKNTQPSTASGRSPNPPNSSPGGSGSRSS